MQLLCRCLHALDVGDAAPLCARAGEGREEQGREGNKRVKGSVQQR